jgi:hypothetical protein
MDKWHHGTLILKTLLSNLREAVIKNRGRKMKIASADALIVVDALVDSNLVESYAHTKPLYLFFIWVIDKYVYKFWSDKHDGKIVSDGQALFKHIRAFLSLQKHKFSEARH